MGQKNPVKRPGQTLPAHLVGPHPKVVVRRQQLLRALVGVVARHDGEGQGVVGAGAGLALFRLPWMWVGGCWWVGVVCALWGKECMRGAGDGA